MFEITIPATAYSFRHDGTLTVADHDGNRFDGLLQGLEFLPGEGRRSAAVLRSFTNRSSEFVESRLMPVQGSDYLLVGRWESDCGYSGAGGRHFLG